MVRSISICAALKKNNNKIKCGFCFKSSSLTKLHEPFRLFDFLRTNEVMMLYQNDGRRTGTNVGIYGARRDDGTGVTAVLSGGTNSEVNGATLGSDSAKLIEQMDKE